MKICATISLNFLIACAMFPFFANSQIAQDLNLVLELGTFLEEKEGEEFGTEPFLRFPNLSNEEYYYDEKTINLMKVVEKDSNFDALDSLLESYITNFTVVNFRVDIGMIWKAGQLKEKMGDTLEAIMYYELGILHTRDYDDQIKNRYDSLVARWKTEWVDLEFYYRLLEARRKIDPLIPPKGIMLNMGPKVNSTQPEYAPFMHPSDSVLIFTARRDDQIQIDDIYGPQNEDLYFCERDWIDGSWSYAERFEDAVNSKFNEGSSCLSRDGKTLIFARCDANDSYGSCDLYSAVFSGGKWQDVQNLGELVNSKNWDSQPNLTPDGKALFFTSNREGSFGGTDIFVSLLQEDGIWGKAINLGPTINTVDHEVTPFFHAINNTLYFSSTGHLNHVGGYDIYRSRWLIDHWEYPRNLGPLVNGNGNEYYFAIDGKGTRLFYAKSSSHTEMPEIHQDFNLYSFPMPMEARPDAIVTLKGYIVDSVTGNPLTGVVLIIDRTSGIEVAPKFINRFGYFEFDLISNHYYEIYIQGENYFTVKEEIDFTHDTTYNTLIESWEKGKPLIFEKFEFEKHSAEMDSAIEPKLDYLVSFLRRYPMFRLKISGHTDADGDAKFNLQLARKRAYKIEKYIRMKAEDFLRPDQVLAVGYGETRPLKPNDREGNMRLNRRVEFELFVDPNYKGDAILPTMEEIDLDDPEVFDPEFIFEEEHIDEDEDFDFNWEDESGLDVEVNEEEDAEFLIEFDVPVEEEHEIQLPDDPEESGLDDDE